MGLCASGWRFPREDRRPGPGRHDEVYLGPERQADLDELRRRLPSWFAGRAVLEIACGTGWWTQFIAPLAAYLTATDAVAEPLAFARLRPGVGRVSFVQADAFALPESLGRFDAAFAGLDPEAPFPLVALRLHRGKDARRQMVTLPPGYTPDRDDDTPPVPPLSPAPLAAFGRALEAG